MNGIINHSEEPIQDGKQKSLLVFSNELLYKLSDAGYLEQLNEVRPNRKRPGHRVYYFDPDPEIEKIIKNYQEERKKEKEETPKSKFSGNDLKIISDRIEKIECDIEKIIVSMSLENAATDSNFNDLEKKVRSTLLNDELHNSLNNQNGKKEVNNAD